MTAEERVGFSFGGAGRGTGAFLRERCGVREGLGARRLERAVLEIVRRLRALGTPLGEPQLLRRGWNRYAKRWRAKGCEILPGHSVRFLGDEWTLEDPSLTGSSYGLPAEAVERFSAYLERELLNPYLPAQAGDGLEIGPGGGRLTELLIPRSQTLHLVDAADAMLSHLRARFADEKKLRFHASDGMTLPDLPPGSLDYVASFDVFVHFEPRLVYWYLRQIERLLKPGATGIIHYASVLTPLGFRQFERHLAKNLQQRAFFAAFGVMCPELMRCFLDALALEVVTIDAGVIPRDAIAIFRKPTDAI